MLIPRENPLLRQPKDPETVRLGERLAVEADAAKPGRLGRFAAIRNFWIWADAEDTDPQV